MQMLKFAGVKADLTWLASSPPPVACGMKGVHPMRVLVIEDSDVDFLIVQRALGDEFELGRSSSLSCGLAMGANNPFDLLILDLTVQDSCGFETFEKARAALPHTPILILTGIEDEDLALRAISFGAQDYVCKSRLLNYPLDRAAKYVIERHRAEKRLQESERFARATVNSLAAHIAILDDTGTILATNTAWKRFADENGMRADEYGVGANYLKVCEQDIGACGNISRAAAAGIRSIMNGEKDDFQLEYPAPSPVDEQWFSMRVKPFEGDGPRRVVILRENITSRKTAERLTREQLSLRGAIAALEQVLGVVGHELRTPLAALRAISEYLATDGARNTAEAEHFLRQIPGEIRRMSHTVNSILEAARLNSGRAQWNWSVIDLVSIAAEAIGSLQPLIDHPSVEIRNHIEPAGQPISGDADAIRRLLVNLLSNALRHTNKGQIEVSARQFCDAAGRWIDLVVRDSGCGIAPELTARLGEAFALNSGVVGANHISGTGLGLAICKGIARAHGGELLIESTPGKGTTVTARLRGDLEAATDGDTVTRNPPEGIAA